jgi:hypothetical protein
MLRKLRKVRRIVDMVAGGAVLEQWWQSLVVALVSQSKREAGESAEVAR